MSQQNRNNNRRYSHNPPYFTNRLPSNRKQESVNDITNQAHQNNSNAKQSISADVNIIENKKWTKAEKISFVSVVFSALVIIISYFLFKQTQKQSDAAVKASNAAVTADSLNKVYNDSSLKIQMETLDSTKAAKKQSDKQEQKRDERADALFKLQESTYQENKADLKERFKRDTTAINLQIKALKQNNEQFVKQNEPYLKISIDSVYMKYVQVKFNYTIFNLSNSPAKVTNQKKWVNFGIDLPFSYFGNPQLINFFDGDFYVIKDAPVLKISTLENIDDVIKHGIMNGLYYIYWYNDFEYTNMITDEKRVYRIKVKMQLNKNVNPPYQAFGENSNASIK